MADLISKESGGFNQSSVKIIPLLFLEIVSAFLMSFYFRQLMTGFSVLNLIWFSAGLALFVIISFLAALFVNELLWSSLAAGLSVIVSLAVFYDYFSVVLLGFGFLIFLILVWGISRLKTDSDNTLKINFSHLSKIFLSKITLATAILLCLFAYFLFSAKGGFPISFESFRVFILKPNEGIISIFVPNFKFQEPLQKVLAGVLENQLSQSIPNFKNLPASVKETVIASAVDQEFGVSLTKALGYQVNLKDSVDKVVYDSLVIKFDQLDPTAKNWIYIGVFVALFFTIRFLFIPINWVLSILMFLIYQLLLAVKFVSIKSESRSKEVFSI
ncbi:MAG: hypothetical protein Q8N22_02750 [bacterium]|nr:hypothetical protein [bacterium]